MCNVCIVVVVFVVFVVIVISVRVEGGYGTFTVGYF